MPPAVPASDAARQVLVETLRQEVQKLEGLRFPAEAGLVPTGIAALDRLLPAGGLRAGSLVEYLAPGPGAGAGTLALIAARAACQEGRALVVLDRQGTFYPPAAAAWGIDFAQLLILRPPDEASALWALDQALRCSGVGAVWAPLGTLDARDFRRLQLAAEAGGTLGLFIRPGALRGQPTWADVQWQVQPAQADSLPEKQVLRESVFKKRRFFRRSQNPHPNPLPKGEGMDGSQPAAWRLAVELVRCRGGPGEIAVVLELDPSTGLWQEARAGHAAHPVSVPVELAPPAAARRA
jgi:protein ImuA